MFRNIYLAIFSGLMSVFFTSHSCKNYDRNIINKVYYINSYHEGYIPSDEVFKGFIENIDNDKYKVKVFYLDTKRTTNKYEIASRVEKALAEIDSMGPDILIVSDDNAVNEVIVPHYKGTKLPVIFCGVNWSARQYNLTDSNITGILEVLPLKSCIENIQRISPGINNIAILSENSLSEQNNKMLLDTLYTNMGLTPSYYLTDDFESWKSAFIEVNEKADLIYIPTNGAIKGWNDEEAESFVYDNIKKPVITCDDFMMLYAVYGLTKIAREQGEWVAGTLNKLSAGENINKIPIAMNNRSRAWFNKNLGNKINLALSDSLLKECTIIAK